MDDAMCPAVKFSEKHYIEISLHDIKKIDKLYKKFKDVAIICVSDTKYSQKNNNYNSNFYGRSQRQFNDEYKDITSQDSLPYYFIAYNKQKFDKIINKLDKKPSGIKKPKHFLYNAWNSGMNFANNSFNGYFGGSINAEEKDGLSDDDYYHDPS